LINDAKELAYQGEAIRYFQVLWTGENLPGGISSIIVGKDIIKINIADYLMQAYKNGLVDIDKDEFQKFAR